MSERWRRCSACKSDIALGAVYWVCSVSTCNRKRTALVFCNVDCWEVHLPTERHREAWAVEERAPGQPDPAANTSSASPRSKTQTGSASRPAPRSTPRSEPAPAVRSPAHIVRKGAERTTSGANSSSPAPVSSPALGSQAGPTDEGEILVVASRLKAYVKAKSGFNTSDRVLPTLSRALRTICDEAIEEARRAERLTVMGRDVPRE